MWWRSEPPTGLVSQIVTLNCAGAATGDGLNPGTRDADALLRGSELYGRTVTGDALRRRVPVRRGDVIVWRSLCR